MLKIKNKPTDAILQNLEENASHYSPQDIASIKHELLDRGVDFASLKTELKILLENNVWTKAQLNEYIQANQTLEDQARAEQIKEQEDKAFKEKIEALKQQGLDCYYQYKVISLSDIKGSAPLEQIQETLNELALYGWRIRCSYTNELGHNSSSLSIGGIGGGLNYTSDEHILILERIVRI